MQDLRIWMYRSGESRIFDSRDHVPINEGWVDTPAKIKLGDYHGEETEGDAETQEPQKQQERQKQGLQVLDFEGLSDEGLREVAKEAGIRVHHKWKRARIEQALREA